MLVRTAFLCIEDNNRMVGHAEKSRRGRLRLPWAFAP